MRRSLGVSLAEIMIATVILASCVLLLMGMFSVSGIRMKQAKALAKVSFLAKEKLEEVLTQEEVSNSEGTFLIPFSEYKYKVTRQEYNDESTLEQIEVMVTAPQRLGGKKVMVVMLRTIL